jgi:hypothetical protein
MPVVHTAPAVFNMGYEETSYGECNKIEEKILFRDKHRIIISFI